MKVTDPRITRTRLHVLLTARRMLMERSGEPLTFSSLSKEAQVSRRTLYVHWGTIEQVISEAVTMQSTQESTDLAGLTPRELLRHFLIELRTSINEPVTNVALSTLVNHAAQDDKASSSLIAMSEARIAQFSTEVAPITAEQYSRLVGPIYFAEFMTRVPASDEFIETLVDEGMRLLGLRESASL